MIKKLQKIYLYAAIALFVYMPFHIFASQWLSTFTGGLETWKIAKDIVTWAVLMFGSLLLLYLKKTDRLFWILWLYLLVFTGLHFILLFATDQPYDTGILAAVYNTRLMWFVIIGYSLTLLFPKKNLHSQFVKYLLIASTIVCAVGFLQWVLPKDIMTHFGYSVERGVKPMFFIDDKPDLPRIMSTIRDPNSLGSFLILPLVIIFGRLVSYWRDQNQRGKRELYGGLFLLHSLAIFLTFSRSAWLGAAVALIVYTLMTYKKELLSLARKYAVILVAALVALSVFVFAMRDQYIVQNLILHSDENTQMEGSTSLHITQTKKGIDGIVDDPEGRGPGTAGLVSAHSDKGGFIPENYFVQIGYEVGLLGLAIFIAWLWLIVTRLRKNAIFIATFTALVVTNTLLHIWANEAVAMSFFLMVGLLLGLDATKRNSVSKKP